jgi:predicted Zn finger-like uncharacterized protein
MNIRCKQCQSQFNIPDHKLPKDKDAVFNCPKCSQKIHVPAMPGTDLAKTRFQATPESRPGGLVQGQLPALVLASTAAFHQSVLAAARQLGYVPDTAANPEEALGKIAYQVYPLVVMEKGGDSDPSDVLAQLHAMDMSTRRKICLVLAGQQFHTGDPMAALHASADYVVGPDGFSHLASVLAAALQNHQAFYRVYMDAMKAAGKA